MEIKFIKKNVTIDFNFIKENKITLDSIEKYFPKYLLHPNYASYKYNFVKSIFFNLTRIFLVVLVKIFLRPGKPVSHILGLKEVDDIYRKEADTYNKKHHLTTRGMDLNWRKNMGWHIAFSSLGKSESILILDLCTGTGLTVQEISKILEECSLKSDIVGLDFSIDMLRKAEIILPSSNNHVVNFVRGDAMDLVLHSNKPDDELVKFDYNTFDFVTQMFGVGGILDPVKEFNGVIRILKPNGQFFIIDMHRPIPNLPGEWPLLLKWLRFPLFESYVYETTTIPLVLNRLWGWRDTTLCFYILPLITYKDENDKFWGFKTVYFEQESQRWWFALPFMPVAKMIVEKVQITENEAIKRGVILKSCHLDFSK